MPPLTTAQFPDSLDARFTKLFFDRYREVPDMIAEFFDVGQSRSLPWSRRPEAAKLLDTIGDPDRGFDAVVIGEPQRAFYGNQFRSHLPGVRPLLGAALGARGGRCDRSRFGRPRDRDEPLRWDEQR